MTEIETLAVHAGRRSDLATGAVLTPLHQVTTFARAGVGVEGGYTYSRVSNPTVTALEERLAALEGGEGAVAFASGIAAIDAVFRRLSAGDHIVLSDMVYGGTVRLLRDVYARHGVTFSFADASKPGGVARAVRPATRLVLIESPANPTLKLADIRAVAQECRAAGVPLAVDNTFLTPYGQRAIDLGADLAIHSTTKYLEGHNATVGGAVVVRRGADWLEPLRLLRKCAGTIMAPFEAWLTLRGTKTLAVRLDRHAASAQVVAQFLEGRPEVRRVNYPGLASHPQRALAARQQRHGGGVVSFELAGGLPAVRRFADALQVVTLAENLGAVESLLTHPATMTHAAYTPQERDALGVTDGLLRISVGLEAEGDILEDLERGLRASRGVPAPAPPAGGAAY
ncbi:MAG TPA: PLP-dependent aspartate aminotransferase family protein [Candidatus Thermoplasmatota archaeon]